MRAYVSKNPFYKPVSETTRTGRQKLTLSKDGLEWDLTTGWHPKRKIGWKGKGLKSGAIKKVSRVTPDGRTITVYKTEGYDDCIGFHPSAVPDQDAIDFGMNAFDESDPAHGQIFSEEGCGHIAKIEYAQGEPGTQRGQVLRVTFANGAICLFFRVPSAVAGELLFLAKDNTVVGQKPNGEDKHMLGVVFWDLVRIRGSHTGARYPFEYQQHSTYKLTHSNKRYVVTLSKENMKDVLGRRYFEKDWRPGEKVSAILSEKEYAGWVEDKLSQEEQHTAALGEKRVSINPNNKDEGTQEVGGVGIDYYGITEVNKNRKTIEEILSPEDYARYKELSQRLRTAQSKADKKVEEAALNSLLANTSKSASKEAWDRVMKLAKTDKKLQNSRGRPDYDKMTDYVLKQLTTESAYYDKRYKEGHTADGSPKPRPIKKGMFKTVTPHQAFSEDKAALDDYLRLKAQITRETRAPNYADIHIARGWTTQELKDFANPTVPGNIEVGVAPLYKRFIDRGEYALALNFLKSTDHTVYSNGKPIARRKYAGNNDYIIEE